MRVLVTGGAGFIGSHTVDALLAAGHAVAVVDDLSGGRLANLHPEAALFELDIRSPELGKVFKEFAPTHVIHFAAQMDVRVSVERPMFDADVNVAGSINVLQQCVDHGVEKFVPVSTAGAIYGEPDILPATEDYPALPLCHYGQSKYAMELFAGLYQRMYGLRYTVVRYSNVYGPRQNPHGEAGVCAILTSLMLDGKTPTLFGHGTPVRDYVYVGDVARANVLALERGDGETLNIATGVGTSVLDIFRIIRDCVGFTGEPELKPIRPGEVNKIYCSREKAKAVLGWEPAMPLEQGLANTVAFIRKQRGA